MFERGDGYAGRKDWRNVCMRVDGVVFLIDTLFTSVMMGQRLCADVFRSLLRSKVSFAGDVVDRIMGLVRNGCQS